MFKQLFETIDKADFLRNYWQKKPCLFRSAFSEPPNYLSANELAGLALEPEIESRLIQFNPNNQKWSLEHGPFIDQRFSRLPEQYWTLLIQSIDHWVPESRELAKHFSFIPKWRFDDLMVSYATDQASVGPHYDHFDVFLVQGLGKRHWRVGQKGQLSNQSEVVAGLSQLDAFDAVIDVELNPGDMLYVPPETAHWGVSIGQSIGYSVGFRALESNQLISLVAEHLQTKLQPKGFFNDSYRKNPDHCNQLEPELTEWAKRQLIKLSENSSMLNHLLSQHLSQSKIEFYPEENLDNLQQLTNDSLLKLNDELCVVWRKENDKIILSVDGEDYRFENYLITAVKKLANFETCSIKLFKKPQKVVDFPEDLANLIDRGYIQIVN